MGFLVHNYKGYFNKGNPIKEIKSILNVSHGPLIVVLDVEFASKKNNVSYSERNSIEDIQDFIFSEATTAYNHKPPIMPLSGIVGLEE